MTLSPIEKFIIVLLILYTIWGGIILYTLHKETKENLLSKKKDKKKGETYGRGKHN